MRGSAQGFRPELHHLGATVQGSQEIASSHETDTAKVRKKIDGLLVSMQAIAMLLQSAGSNPDAMLIPPEEPDAQGHPTRVSSAVWQLKRRGYHP